MRFMLTFVSGVIVGYVLYGRKDQTVEQIVDTAFAGLTKIDSNLRTRVAGFSN